MISNYRYSENVWIKAVEDYKNGKSINKIAFELGCKRANVRKRLICRGVKLRTKDEVSQLLTKENNYNWKGLFVDKQKRVWLNNNETKSKILESHYIWLKHNPNDNLKGFDIHHIDNNPMNNDISNLKKVTRSEHRKIHQSPTRNWLKYKKEYESGKSCRLIAIELNCSRQCVWKNIKDLLNVVK